MKKILLLIFLTIPMHIIIGKHGGVMVDGNTGEVKPPQAPQVPIINTSNGSWMGKVLKDKFDLRNSRFSPNADLRYLLVGYQLGNNTISEVIMNQTTDFSQTNLQESSFVLQNIQGVVFYKADLSGAFLEYAQCLKTDFRNAKLVKADLSYADLSGAKFNAADLTGANLTGAIIDSNTNFSNANLSGAIIDTLEQFHGAKLTNIQKKSMVIKNT